MNFDVAFETVDLLRKRSAELAGSADRVSKPMLYTVGSPWDLLRRSSERMSRLTMCKSLPAPCRRANE
jgi:hypothetical protein